MGIQKYLRYESKTGDFWLLKDIGKGKNRQYKGNKIKGYVNKEGYLLFGINNKSYSAHSLAHLFMTGKIPKVIDHYDRDKINNKWDNIKEPSSKIKNAQNTGNYSTNTSGIKGIIRDDKNNKWIAKVHFNGKSLWYGRHSDFDEAVCYRLAAEQCLDWMGESMASKYVKENIQNDY